MPDANLIAALKILKDIFGDTVKWAIFGSTAISIQYGSMYREIDDIDVVVDSSDELITNLFKQASILFDIKDRRGRHRGYVQINNISVELMFMTTKNTIDIPGGNYSFDKIELVKISDLEVPVIDSQSLLRAKEQYKVFLENKKSSDHFTAAEEKKLQNTYLDIKKIREIINVR